MGSKSKIGKLIGKIYQQMLIKRLVLSVFRLKYT